MRLEEGGRDYIENVCFLGVVILRDVLYGKFFDVGVVMLVWLFWNGSGCGSSYFRYKIGFSWGN